jgi:antitoxin MazE
MRAKAAQWGNSIAVRVPRSMAKTMDLKPGEDLDIVAVPGGLNIRRPAAPRYPSTSLAEMVAEMDRLGPEGRPEVVDWGPDREGEIVDDRGNGTPTDLCAKTLGYNGRRDRY